MEQLCSHWKDFREIRYLSIFRKSVETIQVSLKLKKKRNTGTFDEELCTFTIIICLILLRMRNTSEKIVEKIETHILCPEKIFCCKSCPL